MRTPLTYLLFAFSVTGLFAQSRKDTVVFGEVVKVEQRSADNTGASPFTDLKYLEGQRLSDVLGEFSSVYIKSYGSGGLASLAIQGTSAEQSVIQWNGVSLNSPSLGQVDLSLFLLGMQDQLQLLNAGYEGTIGGTLNLNNEMKIDSGYYLNGTFRAGSFGTYEAMADAQYVKQKFSGSTKVSFLTAQNNFSYVNPYLPESPWVKQSSALTMQGSFLQQFNARVNTNNELNFYVWFSDAARQIPPIMSQLSDKQVQDDRSVRTMADWKGNFRRWKLKLTSAYLNDWMKYTDPNAAINETYLTQALRNKFDCSYLFPHNIFWKSELNYDHEWVNINEYGSVKTRDILGFKTYADYYFLKGFKLHGGFREDLENKQLSAFAPELALDYTVKSGLYHLFAAGITASRNFRFPTLNDLYWIPGGNPGLQEEKSWNGQIQFKYDWKKLLDFSVSNFYIYVDNWIQWVPNGDLWMAENFRRVFSRGIEAAIHLTNNNQVHSKKFIVDFNASYTYTKATNLDAFAAYDLSQGKQLIYVPYDNAVAALQLEYRHFYLRSVNNYTGLVYISTDNSQSLKGYLINSLEAGKNFYIRKMEFGCSLKVNNIGNVQYQVVAQRPMPGRYFEGTLRFKFSG